MDDFSEYQIDSEALPDAAEASFHANEDEFSNLNQGSEGEDFDLIDPTEPDIFDTSAEAKRPTDSSNSNVTRQTKLPLARIKSIMKMDPDVNLINTEALFLVTKATELFLETLAKETYSYMATKKRKTIAKKDLDYVVNVVDCLCFLDGAMDF